MDNKEKAELLAKEIQKYTGTPLAEAEVFAYMLAGYGLINNVKVRDITLQIHTHGMREAYDFLATGKLPEWFLNGDIIVKHIEN